MMALRNSYWVLMLLLAVAPSLSAQPAGNILDQSGTPTTLMECIAFALDNNPQLRSTEYDELAGEYQIKEIKASALPQVTGSASYTDNLLLASQLLPGEIIGQPGTFVPVKFGVRHGITGGVQLRQLLYSKSYRTGLKAAETSKGLFKLNTLQSKEGLVYNIAQLYLQLQITDSQLEIAEANLARITQLINITQAQFEEGLVKKVDVDQLRVNSTNLRTEIQSLQIDYGQQIDLLKFYMGLPMDQEIEITDLVDENSVPDLADQANLDYNTTLRLLSKQQELNALELQNVKDGFYPTLSFVANYNWQGQTEKLFSSETPFNDFGAGSWGLQLSVPIFDGFQKKNKMQQIQIQRKQLELDTRHVTNQTKMEFHTASEQLRQSNTLIHQQEENMKLAEDLYDIIKLSYQEGVAPLTELLNAETSLKEAQTQFLTATLQQRLAELDHLKTSGRLVHLIEQAQ